MGEQRKRFHIAESWYILHILKNNFLAISLSTTYHSAYNHVEYI